MSEIDDLQKSLTKLHATFSEHPETYRAEVRPLHGARTPSWWWHGRRAVVSHPEMYVIASLNKGDSYRNHDGLEVRAHQDVEVAIVKDDPTLVIRKGKDYFFQPVGDLYAFRRHELDSFTAVQYIVTVARRTRYLR